MKLNETDEDAGKETDVDAVNETQEEKTEEAFNEKIQVVFGAATWVLAPRKLKETRLVMNQNV